MLFVIIIFFGIFYVILKPSDAANEATIAWNEASHNFNEYITSEEMHKENHSFYKIPISVESLDRVKDEEFLLRERLKYDSKFKELYYKEKETFVVFLETNSFSIEDHKPDLIKILGYIDDPVLSEKIMKIICF